MFSTRTSCCSSTTSSASPRRVPRSPRCWAACPPPWATSPTWLMRWVCFRSALRRLAATRSPRCRRSTFPPTTTPTRLRRRPSLTWTPRPSFPVRCSPRASSPPWTRWRPARPSWTPALSGMSTTAWPRKSSGSCSVTRTFRTLSRSSVSTSCRRRTSSW